MNAGLEEFFAQLSERASHVSAPALELSRNLADFTLRGGKRLRPATLYAGYCAADAHGELSRVLEVSLALEVMQSYLLIHDDWMDEDEQRRGGPALHAKLRDDHADGHLGDSLALLAGDMACGLSWELFSRGRFPDSRLREASREFARMHYEVVLGQQLDLLGHPDVAKMHDLKTGSYTVRGPLRLGALVADASGDVLDTLERFGSPVGIAFQLRDDLLSTFGTEGKPKGTDLKRGRHSALVPVAREALDGEQRAFFDRVLADEQASAESLERATALLESSGTRERVEDQIGVLLDEAAAVLEGSRVSERGATMLIELAQLLARRDR